MPGLKLVPENGATLTALAQQMVCWAAGDTRVNFASCCERGFVEVPAAVCSDIATPIPVTSDGETITCNADIEYWDLVRILETDVVPTDPDTCLPFQDGATDLAAGTITDTTVPLTWTAATGAVSYNIRSKKTVNGTWATSTGVTGTSYTVVSLTPSTAYDFQIQAVNALGQVSAWSDTVNATTTAALELSAVTESATTRSAKKK